MVDNFIDNGNGMAHDRGMTKGLSVGIRVIVGIIHEDERSAKTK